MIPTTSSIRFISITTTRRPTWVGSAMRIKAALLGGFLIIAAKPVFAGAPPGNPTIIQATTSSLTVVWTSTNSTNGYILDASTVTFGSGGVIISSQTIDVLSTGLSIPGLSPNTAYF